MGFLTTAIVHHDLEGIARAVIEHPEEVDVPVQGFLPIEWAKATGNIITYTRTARPLGDRAGGIDFCKTLREDVRSYRTAGHCYYEANGTGAEAARLI